jgi:hypothetical protein
MQNESFGYLRMNGNEGVFNEGILQTQQAVCREWQTGREWSMGAGVQTDSACRRSTMTDQLRVNA